jgi:brefeldin A-resistance guanine nucleotide exchange factor 1
MVTVASGQAILGNHDPQAFLRSCETLAFLVRDAAHVTPFNFTACLRCIRTFVEASLDYGPGFDRRFEATAQGLRGAVTAASTGVKKKKPNLGQRRSRDGIHSARKASSSTRIQKNGDGSPYDADDSDSEELPSGYNEAAIQLLDLLHTLHTRAASISTSWAEEGESSVRIESLWETAWCPLLQAIARLCCDHRKQVRPTSIIG